jgi:sugar phosphate isomerase/epimerase
MAARLAEQGTALVPPQPPHRVRPKYGGAYILDIIRESAPLLKFELVVHWIHWGGKDSVSVLKDYAGLVDLVHLKDYRIGQLPPNAYEFQQAGDFQAFRTAFEGVALSLSRC